MNIILSIHPKWAKLIYEGKKTIEWRKTVPSCLLPIHLSNEKLTGQIEGDGMKYLKLPFEIVGFVFVTAVTLTLVSIDYALRRIFGEDW